MVNEIVKSINGQVAFTVQKRDLTWHQREVMHLVNSCTSNMVILDEYILQDWFMEKIIKPRNRTVNGNYLGYRNENGHPVYEKILEYNLRQRQIKERGGLMCGWHLAEAKQILKNCIGSLVVKGYLTVIPNIKLSDATQQIEAKNEN